MVQQQTPFQQRKDFLSLTKSLLHIMKLGVASGMTWYGVLATKCPTACLSVVNGFYNCLSLLLLFFSSMSFFIVLVVFVLSEKVELFDKLRLFSFYSYLSY